jgi:hypothetical protein
MQQRKRWQRSATGRVTARAIEGQPLVHRACVHSVLGQQAVAEQTRGSIGGLSRGDRCAASDPPWIGREGPGCTAHG